MFASKLTLTGLMAMLVLPSNVPPTPTARRDSTGPVRGSYGHRYRTSPAYVRKTPSTPADFEALAKAQAKRDRKAAKLLRYGL